jgi:glycerophosphoryl diester phosphodiesterase
MLSIGHRGAMGHEPENTILSVQKALELGADCIEIDVYLVDGHLIVFHDDRLERTTNGHGPIDQNFDYLRTLDAGKGQKIPTLEEIMNTIQLRAGVNIELKGPGLAQPIVDFLHTMRDHGWPDNLLLLSSFNYYELTFVRELDKKIKIGILINSSAEDAIPFALELDAYSVHVSTGILTKEFIETAHTNDLKVFVYTVNRREDIIHVKNLGVDGVFSDFPERVSRSADNRGLVIGWN